jgi:hypothetical protein
LLLAFAKGRFDLPRRGRNSQIVLLRH